jgi:general secretion pathway protein F
MPVYNYKALKEDGGSDAGHRRRFSQGRPAQAEEPPAPRRPTSRPWAGRGEGRQRAEAAFKISSSRGAGPDQVAMLTRQLATLLGLGIPMIGAFTALIDQVEYRDLKAAMMDIREKVSQGGSLSDAMWRHPVYFSELYATWSAPGEAGGNLDKVLFRVADYMHSQNRTRAKVMAALTYPMIMLLIGTGVVVILLTYVVPKIMEVIQKQGKAALPLPTEILLAVSGFMGKYWWLLLAWRDRPRATPTRGRRRRGGSGSTR